MQVDGYFILNPNTPKEERVKNRIVAGGALAFLQKIFQGGDSLPPSYWIGLTGAIFNFDSATLELIASAEPAVSGGYMRQELPRDLPTWDIQEINGFYRARSKTVTWTGTAAWTRAWSRMFICDVAAGTDGTVFMLSGPTNNQQITGEGDVEEMAYEMWMRG